MSASGYLKEFEDDHGVDGESSGDSDDEENVDESNIENLDDRVDELAEHEDTAPIPTNSFVPLAPADEVESRDAAESNFWDSVPDLVVPEFSEVPFVRSVVESYPPASEVKSGTVAIVKDSDKGGNEKAVNDCRRSVVASTSASTIAPEEVRKRVKKQLGKSARSASGKAKAKGEANLVTRMRRENMDNIKESTGGGFWG